MQTGLTSQALIFKENVLVYWVSILDADALVLKHQGISSNNAEQNLNALLDVFSC